VGGSQDRQRIFIFNFHGLFNLLITIYYLFISQISKEIYGIQYLRCDSLSINQTIGLVELHARTYNSAVLFPHKKYMQTRTGHLKIDTLMSLFTFAK